MLDPLDLHGVHRAEPQGIWIVVALLLLTKRAQMTSLGIFHRIALLSLQFVLLYAHVSTKTVGGILFSFRLLVVDNDLRDNLLKSSSTFGHEVCCSSGGLHLRMRHEPNSVLDFLGFSRLAGEV